MAPGDVAFLDGFHVDVKVSGGGEKFNVVVFPVPDDDSEAFHFGDVGLEKGDVYAFSDAGFWVGFAGFEAGYFFGKKAYALISLLAEDFQDISSPVVLEDSEYVAFRQLCLMALEVRFDVQRTVCYLTHCIPLKAWIKLLKFGICFRNKGFTFFGACPAGRLLLKIKSSQNCLKSET